MRGTPLLRSVAVIVAGFLLAAPSLHAQAPSPEWDRAVAAAEKEGSVVEPQREAAVEELNAAHDLIRQIRSAK